MLSLPAMGDNFPIFSDCGPGNSYDGNNAYVVAGAGALGDTILTANAFTSSGDYAVTQIDLGLTWVTGTNGAIVSLWTENGTVPGAELGSWAVFDPLPVGDNHGKALAEFFHDGAGIHARRGQHCRDRGRGTGGREQLQAEGLNAGADHGSRSFRIMDEGFASIGKIAVAAAANVVERRSQSTDQRDGRGKGRFALGRRLALLAQIEVKTRLLGRLPRSDQRRVCG